MLNFWAGAFRFCSHDSSCEVAMGQNPGTSGYPKIAGLWIVIPTEMVIVFNPSPSRASNGGFDPSPGLRWRTDLRSAKAQLFHQGTKGGPRHGRAAGRWESLQFEQLKRSWPPNRVFFRSKGTSKQGGGCCLLSPPCMVHTIGFNMVQ